jgi:predicted nucleic acid-binding protein
LIGITRPPTSLLPDSDPHDWPVVATALDLGAAIWTNDNDFLGTGVAT